MAARARAGEINLDKSIWGLRAQAENHTRPRARVKEAPGLPGQPEVTNTGRLPA